MFYDMTFRQLMSSKLLRNWSKTYVQGWNLAMTDPIGKARSFQDARNGNASNSSVAQSNGSRRDSWKDRCCWKYNRNKCNRGNSCDWDHRCTYCGGWYHSFVNCRKCLKKDSKNRDRSQSPPSGKRNSLPKHRR